MESIQREVILKAKLETPETIGPGSLVGIRLVLRNTSKEKTYPIVKPGDGSEAGWREPYVFFTAQHQTASDKWESVPKVPYLRCGLYDANWQKDVLMLKPGEQFELKEWLPSPAMMLEIQEAGRVRLYAHYRYSRGGQRKGEHGKAEPIPDSMKGIPAFELVSRPVELFVVRRLELTVKVKVPLKVKTKTKLSELLDIQLVNASMSPVPVASPTLSAATRLGLEIKGRMPGWAPTFGEQTTTYGIKQDLPPRKSLPLLGPSDFANGMDGTWEYPTPDKVKVRAYYRHSAAKPVSLIYSDWVEVEVVE